MSPFRKTLLLAAALLLAPAAARADDRPYYLLPDGTTSAGEPTYTLGVDGRTTLAAAGPAPAARPTVTPAPCPCAGDCECPGGKCPSGCPTAAADPKLTQVKVTAYLGDSAGCGTGTVVACEGGRSLILTNKHVAESPAADYWVTHAGADGKTWQYQCRLTYQSPAYDLAVLETAHELPACVIADAEPEPGAAVRQWGFTNGGPKVERSGRYLGVRGWTEQFGGVQPTAAVGYLPVSGDSGSGVFDPDGRLCAVVHLACTDGRQEGSAVPLRCVTETLTTVTTTMVTVTAAGPRFPRLAARLAARRAARNAPNAMNAPPVQAPANTAPKAAPQFVVPGPAPLQQAAPPGFYVLPAAGGCAGGSCAPPRAFYYRR